MAAVKERINRKHFWHDFSNLTENLKYEAMKKLSFILATAIVFASCKDTADKAEVIEDTRQATIDSMKIEVAKQEAEKARQKTIDSMEAVAAAREAKAKQPVVIHNTTTAAPATQQQQRKGWSNAAKGAAIGAGVGAVTGAVISKKKGEGAIIGGLAGAGVGAGTGAIIDSEKKRKGK
jgi:ElaB/YqjD/DUF883 family membrane-anchored ribosome-binding protein